MIKTGTDTTGRLLLTTDLRAIYFLLREKAWLLGSIIGVAGLLGLIVALNTAKIYVATATLQIEEEQQRLIRAADHPSDERGEEQILNTLVENLRSPALFLRLGQRSELQDDAAFLRGVSRPISDAKLRTVIAGKVNVKIRRGTRLIDVSVEDENPALAAKIANLLVEEYLRSSTESRAGISQSANTFLRAEAERAKATLTRSEEALQRYREEHHAVSLEEKQNIIVERLKELSAKVTVAKGERLRLDSDRAQIAQLTDPSAPERLLGLASIMSATEVADLRRRLGEKESEMAALSQRYKAEHPRFIQAATERTELENALHQAIFKAADGIHAAFEAAQATETKLEEALHAQETRALELSQIAIPYQALSREVESDRALYQSVLARLKETDVAQGVSPYAVYLAAPAIVPDRAARPSKLLILLFSLGSGVAVGLTTVLGLHVMDRSLRTVDEAEQALGLRLLGAIPKTKHNSTSLVDARRLLIEDRQSALAESFRALRTQLLFAQGKDGPHAVLFASAVPGEGKSFCSILHAVSLAQQGFRTLLIDADLRMGSLGQAMLGNGGLAGVSELLLKRRDWEEAVHLTDITNLSVLPAGARLIDPPELLGRAPFAEILKTALERFDRVVIDTAPVHAVSDTLLLAPYVEAVCLVLRAGETPRAVVERAALKLRESGAKLTGFVLNGLPSGHGGYYFHYQAAGYGSDEVYGASAVGRK